jgi:hypothetical protein
MAGKFTRMINGVPRTVQIDGSVTVSSGATSATVSFPATLQTGNSTPNVVAWLIDTTDTNPQFQPTTITAYSSTGFTVTWNAPTATANYIIAYHVVDGWSA